MNPTFKRTNVVAMWFKLENHEGKYRYYLHIKNEGRPDESMTGYDKSCSKLVATGYFDQGISYRIIFKLMPQTIHSKTMGEIALWINNKDYENPDAFLKYNWGVTPDASVPIGYPKTGFDDGFEARFGIYRFWQQKRMRILYDNIILSDDYDEAVL